MRSSAGPKPALWSIPAHGAFADALVAGLLARHGGDPLGLARGTLILPNNRARGAVQAAFVRAGGTGLLMPRLATIGDADLDESIGHAFDPIGGGDPVPPAIAPLHRRLLLAAMIAGDHAGRGQPIAGEAAFRLAEALARVIDQLHYEEVDAGALAAIEAEVAALATHWQSAFHHLQLIVARWPGTLAKLGLIDGADRRNRLLDAAAARWRRDPPPGWVMAAGISTAAPAIARLLRVIADLPQGGVVLAGLDMAMDDAQWDALGPTRWDEQDSGARALEAHPNYHLKLLLDRMGVARAEVQPWAGTSPFDGPASRDGFVSLLFAPAAYTAAWQAVAAPQRALPGVSAARFASDGDQAKGIALMLRHALETPGRTAALVTPDRALATRVAAILTRWGIAVDDSAGRPLAQMPPGVLVRMVTAFAAAPGAATLIALLGHPLVHAGEGRRTWMDQVRALDLLLRGPGLVPGLGGIDARITALAADAEAPGHAAAADLLPWWRGVQDALATTLSPLFAGCSPAAALDAVRTMVDGLSEGAVWRGVAGRDLARMFEDWALVGSAGPAQLSASDVDAMLGDMLAAASVRPAFGGHPRLFIWGLLEARLQRADLMILGALDEGHWPQPVPSDVWLAPGIRRRLGLGAPERQQGLAAHDFAAALGAREVVVTRAERYGGDPAVASRFWLRLMALAGELPPARCDGMDVTDLVRQMDHGGGRAEPALRPAPAPPAAARPRHIRVTAVDRLAKDPYAYYARAVLGLSALDAIGEAPDAAWLGTRVHQALEDWQRRGGDAAALEREIDALIADPALDPLARAFWLPRIIPALRWVAAETAGFGTERRVLACEVKGSATIHGVTLTGKADRIDWCDGGTLAIVDYKTGKAPAAKAAAKGLDNQLGLLGLLAQKGALPGVDAERVSALEYWSLKRANRDNGDGKRSAIHGGRAALAHAADAVDRAEMAFDALVHAYLLGDAPFVPGTHAEAARYDEYHQLMRRDEWFARGDARDGEEDA